MHTFGKQLKETRTGQDMSMQTLADKARVSKSMISKIERGEVQPTLDVSLRLAHALKKPLTELLHETTERQQFFLIKKDQQPIWQDPHSKTERRIISPIFEGLEVESIIVTLPAKTSIGKCPPHPTEKLLYILEGCLYVVTDAEKFKLESGDSFFFKAEVTHEFVNEESKPASYLLIMHHL